MTPEVLQGVNDVLTSGLVVACYYASQQNDHVTRHDCTGLASVVYGPLALCKSCDLRRSAVGRSTVGRLLADPESLVDVLAARERAAEAEAALAAAVARARGAGHRWSAIGTVLGLSRQGAQQRFVRACQQRMESTDPSEGR